MAYQQLNINTIIDYLKTIDEMKNIFSSFDDLEILPHVVQVAGDQRLDLQLYQRFRAIVFLLVVLNLLRFRHIEQLAHQRLIDRKLLFITLERRIGIDHLGTVPIQIVHRYPVHQTRGDQLPVVIRIPGRIDRDEHIGHNASASIHHPLRF